MSLFALPRSPRVSLWWGTLLTLSLSACGGGGTPAAPPSGTVQISGSVTLPAGALSVAAPLTEDLSASSNAEFGDTDIVRVASLAAEPADWDAPHVPGELLVSSGGLSAQTLDTQLAGLRSESLSDLGVVRVWTPQPEQLAQQLAAQGITSQPNYVYTALATPNDPGFPGNAGVQVGGVREHQDYLAQIGAAQGWEALRAQKKAPVGVLTAILDTGVDRRHPDLAGRVTGGYDFCSTVSGSNCVGTDSDYSDILTQPYGHGTAMTGLVGAATNNGIGLSGVTWSGPLLAVKVLGDVQGVNTSSGTTVSLAQGLKFAVDRGARVINMSVGFSGMRTDAKVREQLVRAAKADILMIAAAGNSPSGGLYFPANQPEVMAVGAVNPAGQMSCFSARPLSGQTLDLLAPGGESGCGRAGSAVLELTRDGGYQLGAGTSEASALTSGAASLIRAAYPELKAAQVRQALIRGGKPTDSAQRQLNLPGALAAAKALAPAPVYYDLTVQAYQNGKAVGQPDRKMRQRLTSPSLPYQLNVPKGTYELRAEVKISKVYTGKTTVTAQTNVNKNIPVR